MHKTHISEMGTYLEMCHVVPHGVHANKRYLYRTLWAILVEHTELGRHVIPHGLELLTVGTRWHVEE